MPGLVPRWQDRRGETRARLAGSSLMCCHKTCSRQRRNTTGTVGAALPGVLLQECLCGRTRPGFQAQRQVSVYVRPGEDLKNKCRKSRGPKCFPLLLGLQKPHGVSSSVRTVPEESEAAQASCHLSLMFCFSLYHPDIFIFVFLLPKQEKSIRVKMLHLPPLLELLDLIFH